MKDGAIVAEGKPNDIVNEHLVETAFGLPFIVIPDPVAETPMVVPKGRRSAVAKPPGAPEWQASGEG